MLIGSEEASQACLARLFFFLASEFISEYGVGTLPKWNFIIYYQSGSDNLISL